MTANTATMKYAASATYGNVAYDLNRVRGYADERAYELPEERTAERAVPRTRTRTRAHAKPVSISFFAVMGFAVVAALMICVLLSYVRLTEISENMTALENQLSELTDEEKKLTVAYEKAFNLAEVEEYAINELNMTKLTADQVTVLDIDREDKAEILAGEDPKGLGVVAGAAEFITSLMAYLR